MRLERLGQVSSPTYFRILKPTFGRPLAFALVSMGVLAAACSHEDKPSASTPVCGPNIGQLKATAAGVVFDSNCDQVRIALLPLAKIDSTWFGGPSSACSLQGNAVQCQAGDYGSLSAAVSGSTVRVSFEAARDGTLEALSLEGSASVEGATGWLSNGFQSWSQSGVLALQTAPSADALDKALLTRGGDETSRLGSELSHWYTYVGGAQMGLVAGATSSALFRSYLQVFRSDGNGLGLRLVNGQSGERIAVRAGTKIEGESWAISAGNDLGTLLETYGRSLPSRRTDKPLSAPVGWNSWYELSIAIDSAAIRDNAARAEQVLSSSVPAGTPLRIVIDDGWERGWGDWEPNSGFEPGMDKLASELKEKGFETGIWIAPLLVDSELPIAKAHPSWFVQGATYTHPFHSPLLVLDATHPEAAAHLANTIKKLVGWGYSLLKIDFLFAGTYEGTRHEAVTGMQAYHRALSIIRDAAGPDTMLVAVGAPPHPSFSYVDGWRLGADIAYPLTGPQWSFIANQARSMTSRWPLCYATLCDADPPLLRQLPQAEVDAGIWIAASAGGAMFLSDDLRALPSDRASWIDSARVKIGLGGVPAIPESHVPDTIPDTLTNMELDMETKTNDHRVPSVWRMPDQRRVGFNFGDEDISREGVTIPPHAAVVLAPSPKTGQ